MKIKVYSRSIKKSEIEKFINLLPSRYKNLNVEIIIYGSKLHSTVTQWISCRKKSKNSSADFNAFHNSIRVFLYMIKKDKYYKIRVFESLLHEIRHKYQSIYYKEKFNFDVVNYIDDGEDYLEQWIERDAYKFTRRVMNLFKNKINEIININEDWKIYYNRKH